MKNVHEATFFSYGDSTDMATWSNVPYFLTNTVRAKGIKVNRVNVKPNAITLRIWNSVVLRLIHLVLPKSTYTFDRTPFFRLLASRKMKRAVKEFKNSDVFISISFSFHPGKYTDKPVVMFCDWSYDYYFTHFLKRKPDALERQEIVNQNNLFRTATQVFVLFPDVRAYLEDKVSGANFTYLGNVINSPAFTVTNEIVARKFRKNKIVFIGSQKYLPGLIVLLNAIDSLPDKLNVTVDVIGIQRSQCDYDGRNVSFFGYLNKSNKNELDKYYEIVNDAKLLVNTTPGWAGFSSTLDAMYHATPVVVSKYRSFVETFGNDIAFGRYSPNDTKTLAETLREIMEAPENKYANMSIAARRAVNDFTWGSFVDKLLDHV